MAVARHGCIKLEIRVPISVLEVLYLSWLHAVYIHVHVNVHVQFAMAVSFTFEHVCIVQ